MNFFRFKRLFLYFKTKTLDFLVQLLAGLLPVISSVLVCMIVDLLENL